MSHHTSDRPHRRYNPLTGDWILVSPHRGNRPWQGAQEQIDPEVRPQYDANCYLCPGNLRITGDRNPEYTGTYAFPNDFPAILPPETDGPATKIQDDMLVQEDVSGEARVLCYSPRHDLGMARLGQSEIEEVVAMWCAQYQELAPRYASVQIFENKGAAMGCSNPHPHGQVWATDFVPTELAKEDAAQRAYFETNGRALLADYATKERSLGTRVVFETDHWLCLVPYWAAWPFETMLLPLGEISRFSDLCSEAKRDLAAALKRLTTRYDNLFSTEFPYSMGWHGAPHHTGDAAHWRLHAHFYPPLLRSATVRKFMVGFELLGETQRDLTPEKAAGILRDLSETHYRDTAKS